jgi:CubicO group peptidase (beta-lactamase class C family)
VFGPLGMIDTGFSVPAANRARLTSSYFTDPETGLSDLWARIEPR